MRNVFSSVFTSGGRITIDGKDFVGRSVIISGDGVVTVDGVTHGSVVGNISVELHGDCDSLENTAGSVKVSGSAGSARTVSGDIECGNVSGDVSTTSGDVTCGPVSGSVRSVSGDIRTR